MNKHNPGTGRAWTSEHSDCGLASAAQFHTYIRTLDKAHNELSARLESEARTVAS